MTATMVIVTSTSQGPEATILGSRGSQDLPTKPIINVENIDVREYRFNYERKHTTMAK